MAVSAPRSRTWSPARVPRRLLLLGLAAIVATSGTYSAITGNPLTRNQQAATFPTSAVKQGTLQVTVSATGPITNPQTVPLSFKSSGKLSQLDVGLGQQVAAGQVLAQMDTTDLQAAVDQAQASLSQQQANLAKVSAGATPQQAALSQSQIDAAQSALDGAQKNLQAAQSSSASALPAAQVAVATAPVTLASSPKALQSA